MSFKSIAAIVLATLVSACAPPARSSLSPVEGDSFLGPADASVTVIEFGAPTCPGCKAWHDRFWAPLKSTYIDPGKIKFIFREFPSHNPPVDAAIFAIARCAGTGKEDGFFAVIDEAFARQNDIEQASHSSEGPQKELVKLGQKFRLSEAQVKACIQDPKHRQRIFDVQEDGFARGVEYTPTFFINDRMVQDASFEAMSREIETLLAGAAPTTPTEAPAVPAGPAPAPGQR